MEKLFLCVLATAGAVSVPLLALLLPLKGWLSRYAPQVRWTLWRGFAALLVAGSAVGFFAGGALRPAVVVEIPDRAVTIPLARADAPRLPTNAPRPTSEPHSAPTGTAPIATEAHVSPTVTKKAVELTALALAGWAWLVIALALISIECVRYLASRRRLLRASVPAGEVANLRDIDGSVEFRVLSGIPTPVTIGIARPVVFLTDGSMSPMAAVHEVTHVKRRDIPWRAFIFAVCALFWFDPVVWLMARAAARDMEAACDADVVSGFTPSERRSYGELLIASAADKSPVPLSTCFGGGKKELKDRLRELMRPGKQSRAVVCVLLAVALTATMLVACVSVKADDSPEPDTPPATEGPIELNAPEDAAVPDEPYTGVDPTAPLEDNYPPFAESSAKELEAFARTLREFDIEFPDASNVAQPLNVYMIADVDNDSKNELTICLTSGPTASHTGCIFGYDEEKDETYYELAEYPAFVIYPNGTILAESSHNHTYGDPWPYTLYRHDPEADIYVGVAHVSAMSKSIVDQIHEVTPDADLVYPIEADISGSGNVYYIGETGFYDSGLADGHVYDVLPEYTHIYRAADTGHYYGDGPIDELEYKRWLASITGGERPYTVDAFYTPIEGAGTGVAPEPQGILGFDKCRVETEECAPRQLLRHYYVVRGGAEVCVAEQFGYGDLEAWSRDLDGDGVPELITNDAYGDGVREVIVYRNNGGVIERGAVRASWYEEKYGWTDVGAGGIMSLPAERYDPARGVFTSTNYCEGGGQTPVTVEFDDGLAPFEFEAFVHAGA